MKGLLNWSLIKNKDFCIVGLLFKDFEWVNSFVEEQEIGFFR